MTPPHCLSAENEGSSLWFAILEICNFVGVYEQKLKKGLKKFLKVKMAEYQCFFFTVVVYFGRFCGKRKVASALLR